jgi:hypothetical protein
MNIDKQVMHLQSDLDDARKALDSAIQVGRRQGLEAALEACDKELARWAEECTGIVGLALDGTKKKIRALIVELPVLPEQPKTHQIGTSLEADFEKRTWTFEMHDDFHVSAGDFYLVPVTAANQVERSEPNHECKSVPDIAAALEKRFKKRAFELYKKHITGRGYVWDVGCSMPDDVQKGVIEGMREMYALGAQSGISSPPHRPHEQNAVSAALPAQEGWISVEDRLPEDDCAVIVAAKRFIDGAPAIDKAWFRRGTGEFDSLLVTHWMPLPASPEGKK